MYILGIDPGKRAMGFCAIKYGVKPVILKTHTTTSKRDWDLKKQVVLMFEAAEAFAAVYEPDLIVVEDFVYQGRSITKSGREVDRIVGALLLLSRTFQMSLYSPQDWKQALVGKHMGVKADDAAVKWAVELRTGYVFQKGDKQHAIDAAGVALVGGDREVRKSGSEKVRKERADDKRGSKNSRI